jgi:hypothetical protein
VPNRTMILMPQTMLLALLFECQLSSLFSAPGCSQQVHTNRILLGLHAVHACIHLYVTTTPHATHQIHPPSIPAWPPNSVWHMRIPCITLLPLQ